MVDLTRLSDDDLAVHLAQLDREDDERRARLEAPDALTRAARWYGAQGIAVFPLKPGGKQPLIGKAHPDDPTAQRECKRGCGRDGHGLYDATTDPERINGWWTTTPQANIGLRTGLTFDVLDVDGPAGMRTYSDQIIHAGCPRRPGSDIPSCCDDRGHRCPGNTSRLLELAGTVLGVALTRGENGGMHIYMPPTGSANGTSILPGIDYRGAGGYVVAPPSRARLGRYTWHVPLDTGALAAAA
jgi:hypothetical protein